MPALYESPVESPRAVSPNDSLKSSPRPYGQQGDYQDLESQLRTAKEPSTEGGYSRILFNRNDILNWQGQVDIERYPLNVDKNPEIILQQNFQAQNFEYNRDIKIRYLQPPTPPPAGEILIRYNIILN